MRFRPPHHKSNHPNPAVAMASQPARDDHYVELVQSAAATGAGAGAGTPGSSAGPFGIGNSSSERWQRARDATPMLSEAANRLYDMVAVVRAANDRAKEMVARATEVEPGVTMLLQYLARANRGQMFGLEYRCVALPVHTP